MTDETKLSLLVGSPIYKPFKYPWAYEAWHEQQRIHWLPEEVSMADDAREWQTLLTAPERNLLTQIFRFFVQSDVEVQNCYHEVYSRVFKPTEVKMMLAAFSNQETIHVAAYSHLLDTIGIPEVEYQAFLQYKEMKNKYDYMQTFGVSDAGAGMKHNLAVTMAAFGAFTEGLQLFASFAILLNFPRNGKMRGMGQIITWSVRDECCADGTEILTPSGWVDLADLNDDSEVAQWSAETGEISFVRPSRRVEFAVDGELVELAAEKKPLSLLVTPEHDIVYEYDSEYKGRRTQKSRARDFVPHTRKSIPVAGRKVSGRTDITPLERFRVAFAADGSLPAGMGGLPRSGRHTGARVGYLRVVFSLKKQRKIDRLHRLLHDARLTYESEGDAAKPGFVTFRVNAPLDISKEFSDWVQPGAVSASWCDGFFEELLHWDGHDARGDGGSRNVFGTVRKREVDTVQALAAISGRLASWYVQTDDPRGHSDYHRVSVSQQTAIRTGGMTKRYVPYKGKVRCVTVPAGAIVVRYKGDVQITGNSLHCEAIIKLWHTFLGENPEVRTPDLLSDVRQVCRTVVEHEDAFIDLAFEQGDLPGLTAIEVKRYIRYIADRRLIQLDMDSEYHVRENPLPWLDEMLNAVEHTNFFENRSTEYSKASITGEWADAFDEDEASTAAEG